MVYLHKTDSILLAVPPPPFLFFSQEFLLVCTKGRISTKLRPIQAAQTPSFFAAKKRIPFCFSICPIFSSIFICVPRLPYMLLLYVDVGASLVRWYPHPAIFGPPGDPGRARGTRAKGFIQALQGTQALEFI
jgi:hypothetical protein